MNESSDYFYKGPSITLSSGRVINLQSIDQVLTYAHILEGIPYGSDYSDILEWHFERTNERYPNNKIICVEPKLRPIKTSNNYTSPDNTEGFISNNDLVSIGSVCCRALFESKPIDENEGDLSALMIIWFQDGFCMPIDNYVIETIKDIDWDKLDIDTFL